MIVRKGTADGKPLQAMFVGEDDQLDEQGFQCGFFILQCGTQFRARIDLQDGKTFASSVKAWKIATAPLGRKGNGKAEIDIWMRRDEFPHADGQEEGRIEQVQQSLGV